MTRPKKVLIGLAFAILIATPILFAAVISHEAALASSVALAICTTPLIAALPILLIVRQIKPEIRIGLMMLGGGLRMMLVLTASAVVTKKNPNWVDGGGLAFWGSLIIYYSVTLGMSVTIAAVQSKLDP